jgi:hypothetical protein
MQTSTFPIRPQERSGSRDMSALNDQCLKTTIGEDTILHLSIWHSGAKEALLMHVGSTLDAIKKHGRFKDHEEAQELYVSQKEAAKQVKATLTLLDGVTSKGAEISKKSSRKAKEAEAIAEAPDP